jgi:hypothetical protein
MVNAQHQPRVRSPRAVWLWLALLAGVVSGAQAASAEDVARIELVDQHGRTDSLAAHAGDVVVVFVVTANGLLNTKAWEEDLRALVDEVAYLRIADVPAGSTATHERVAAKLQIVVPQSVSVMIDVERRWAAALGLETRVPNLLLYTRQGQLAARYRGRWHPDSVAEVAERLRQIKELP